MEHIHTELREGLLIVTMARGKANALNGAMVEELHVAVEQAGADARVRGVVLASDRPKFFSGGFDVTEVFHYDRETMTAFFRRFMDLYANLLALPRPVVAAVSGHAFAGGAVLALACDARVMAAGSFGFALNEINIGLALPPGIVRLAVGRAGAETARRVVMEGTALTPAQALACGLASELADPGAVLERAVARARELADKPPLTFAAIKRLFNETAGLLPTGDDQEALGRFIEHWFSPESTHHRQALIESLRRSIET